ncbi:MAG TPA: hypothetical protein VGS18_03905, partial [Thermoplasmata archaeon]|nr:hypothetical protein [Thermoplasmata archaeon]
IGGLSLSGIPPFAGFFSKDDVLGSVYAATATHPEYWPFFLAALVTVFLTAYYIFRAGVLAFSGERPREAALPAAHDPPWVMRLPLVVLSALALFAGFLAFVPGFAGLLPGAGIPPAESPLDLALSAVSLGLGLAGISLAYLFWGNGRVYALPEGSPAAAVRALLLRRYFFKEGYDRLGSVGVFGLARASDLVERYVIDGAVRGLERGFGRASDGLRRIQSGVVSDYAAYVVSGLVGFLLLLLFVAPWLVSTFSGGG